MLNPPFKRLAPADAVLRAPAPAAASSCCESHEADDISVPAGRTRLSQIDPHLHCSIIGTCLTTSELRKLMARFLDVQGASDLDIHHNAVRLAAQNAAVAKALQKALDQRHAPALQRFSKVQDTQTLAAHWDEALRQGEVPAAYWAVLTHRRATPDLRQQAFGDVHMLSHLVGAANRADIRRLVALERENAELRERLDRHQLRSQELIEEKDRKITSLEQAVTRAASPAPAAFDAAARTRPGEAEAAAALVAVQTERRERAERAAALAAAEVTARTEELAQLRQHAMALGRELGAAEAQLREMSDGGGAPAGSYLDRQLRGRRILYVGGRPSSAPAIRDLVLRHGGEIQRHGGGLEDRKGLLASAVAWAQVVVFPVDCIDHDSAGNLKRLCVRQQVPFIPLRGAGIGSFAAAFSSPPPVEDESGAAPPSGTPLCLRHG